MSTAVVVLAVAAVVGALLLLAFVLIFGVTLGMFLANGMREEWQLAAPPCGTAGQGDEWDDIAEAIRREKTDSSDEDEEQR